MGEVMKFPQGAGRQRNASIELLRIVCIAMVTFNHTLNAFYNDGAGALFARYLNFFNICAVGTFFIITGFFLCDGEFAYGKKLKKLLVQVLLPTVFVLLFLVLMGSIWDAAEGAPFGERLLSGLVSVGRETLAWGYSGNYGYLWFVLSYTEIVVFYPVWYLLCKEERVSVVARRLCMSLCFAGIFADNVLHIARASFNLHIFSLINSCVLFVLLGYELKLLLARGKLRGAAGGGTGLALYLAGVALGMAFSSVDTYGYGEFSWYWYHLENVPAILSAAGLFIAFYRLPVRGNGALFLVSRATFYVYLLQSPFHAIHQRAGLNAVLFPHIGVASYLVIFLIVAAASFAVATGIEWAKEQIVAAWRRRPKRERPEAD